MIWNPNDRRAAHKLMLKTILSIVVILACAGVLCFRFVGISPRVDARAHIGIGEALAQQPEASELQAYYALRRSVMELTDPTGLGRIRVLVQGRDVPDEPPRGLR